MLSATGARLKQPESATSGQLSRTPIRLVAAAAVHARTHERVAFVDLARVLAILMMIQGHVLDALLSPDYRATTGFYVWSFMRGLTSCLFLTLAGFVFAVATRRRWRHDTSGFAAHAGRLRRYAVFLVLGYTLHFPARRLLDLRFLTDEAWRGFLAVDILQCIAVSLLMLQIMVLLTRTSTGFAVASAVTCVAVVTLAPVIWRLDTLDLPLAATSYLTARTGSLFPVLPWAAYMFLGAALGERYLHAAYEPQLFATRVLVPFGLLLLATGLMCARVPLEPFGSTDFWSTSPNLFLMRTGLVLLLLALVAHTSRFFSRCRWLIQPVSEETLLVYLVHICLVYGSRWNVGFRQIHGNTVSLASALTYVVALWLAMSVLGITWNHVKRCHPGRARWVRVSLVSLLIASVL